MQFILNKMKIMYIGERCMETDAPGGGGGLGGGVAGGGAGGEGLGGGGEGGGGLGGGGEGGGGLGGGGLGGGLDGTRVASAWRAMALLGVRLGVPGTRSIRLLGGSSPLSSYLNHLL